MVVEVVLGIHWWSESQCWWSQERTEGLSGGVGGPMDELKVCVAILAVVGVFF